MLDVKTSTTTTRKHCGKQDCMLQCTCDIVKTSASGRPLRTCNIAPKPKDPGIGDFYIDSIESSLNNISDLPILSHAETINPEEYEPQKYDQVNITQFFLN